jgi:ribonuclease BN (tRNA processing enzyme)
VQIEVLGGYGGEAVDRRMTCLLINGTISLDAGSLSQALPVERQREIKTIFLTHSHVDHTCSLPFFIENVYEQGKSAVDLYASPETIYALRKNLFNNAAWPDFTRLPNNLVPSVRFRELAEEVPIEVAGVRFTPISVDHLVPTFGFLIEHEGVAVLWSSDTGPTTRLWEIANRTPHLRAVCVETSFDNSMQAIADASFHLTPQTLATELLKLERTLPVLLHHMKPPCVDQIHREVEALDNPQVGFLQQGRTYRF